MPYLLKDRGIAVTKTTCIFAAASFFYFIGASDKVFCCV